MFPQLRTDLPHEIDRVGGELAVFRDEYLPALLGRVRAGDLGHWRNKTDALIDRLLDHPSPQHERPLDPPTPPYSARGGRCVWRVQVFVTIDMALACPVFRDDPDGVTGPWDRFFRTVEEVKRWICTPPFDRVLWADTLCVLPPFIAEVDPAFVRRTLDPRTWREFVLADRTCTEPQRVANLRAVEGSFGRVLNNALLHALVGLANNHFPLIRDYLHHPHLHGGYTPLMPAYVFQVLAAKVDALRRLAGDQPVGRRPRA